MYEACEWTQLGRDSSRHRRSCPQNHRETLRILATARRSSQPAGRRMHIHAAAMRPHTWAVIPPPQHHSADRCPRPLNADAWAAGFGSLEVSARCKLAARWGQRMMLQTPAYKPLLCTIFVVFLFLHASCHQQPRDHNSPAVHRLGQCWAALHHVCCCYTEIRPPCFQRCSTSLAHIYICDSYSSRTVKHLALAQSHVRDQLLWTTLTRVPSVHRYSWTKHYVITHTNTSGALNKKEPGDEPEDVETASA